MIYSLTHQINQNHSLMSTLFHRLLNSPSHLSLLFRQLILYNRRNWPFNICEWHVSHLSLMLVNFLQNISTNISLCSYHVLDLRVWIVARLRSHIDLIRTLLQIIGDQCEISVTDGPWRFEPKVQNSDVLFLEQRLFLDASVVKQCQWPNFIQELINLFHWEIDYSHTFRCDQVVNTHLVNVTRFVTCFLPSFIDLEFLKLGDHCLAVYQQLLICWFCLHWSWVFWVIYKIRMENVWLENINKNDEMDNFEQWFSWINIWIMIKNILRINTFIFSRLSLFPQF